MTSTRRAVRAQPATAGQYHRAKTLGYTGSSTSLGSHDMAEEKIAKLEAKMDEVIIRIFVPAWERGEDLLAQGYIVEPISSGHYTYRITRPAGGVAQNPDRDTTSYHVSLNPAVDGVPACDCPDSTKHGDEHTCKHVLAVSVWVWGLAQEATDDYSEYLEAAGVMRLRRAYEARSGTK